MSGPFPGGSANPQAGGQNAQPTGSNPPAGGSQFLNPAQGAPAGVPGSNPPAGGSSDTQASAPDDNAPIARDVYNERVRAENALRKRLQELEERAKREEDAKLTEQERNTKRLAEIEAERAAWQIERQNLLMQRIIDDRVRERNLVDSDAVHAILMAKYADQIDYDDDGIPTNAPYLIDRLVEKYPFLVNQPAAPTPPGSGRPVSPPRAPNGALAGRNPQQPIPGSQFARLSDIDWTKPGGQGQ